MEAEGAGRFRAGIPSAGHAGRVAELSVESRHAGIRCSAGRSRRYDRTGRAGVSGGHRQFRQHSRVWCTVSVQSGQIRAGRDRPVLSHHRHAQHHHRSRHSFGIRRNEAGTCSDQSSAAKLSDITLPYYSSVHRVTTESYDLTSQMPALYLLEALARRVYNRLLE